VEAEVVVVHPFHTCIHSLPDSLPGEEENRGDKRCNGPTAHVKWPPYSWWGAWNIRTTNITLTAKEIVKGGALSSGPKSKSATSKAHIIASTHTPIHIYVLHWAGGWELHHFHTRHVSETQHWSLKQARETETLGGRDASRVVEGEERDAESAVTK